ncbi:MAG: hypothetical protein LBV28_02250, partial [Puniceicoccales bacterium]|nr:hypothetical protein [Puniceicoccales bacterium]
GSLRCARQPWATDTERRWRSSRYAPDLYFIRAVSQGQRRVVIGVVVASVPLGRGPTARQHRCRRPSVPSHIAGPLGPIGFCYAKTQGVALG